MSCNVVNFAAPNKAVLSSSDDAVDAPTTADDAPTHIAAEIIEMTIERAFMSASWTRADSFDIDREGEG
jgi:hypothetical protein